MRIIVLALVITFAAALPAAAQQDEEGCKDHALFARMTGFHISGCDSEEASAFEFDTPGGGTITVKGRYSKIDYWLKDDARQPTTQQVVRHYWSLIAPKGATKVLEQVTPAEATLTAKMPGAKGAGAVWLQLHVTMEGEVYSLTIVEEK